MHRFATCNGRQANLYESGKGKLYLGTVNGFQWLQERVLPATMPRTRELLPVSSVRLSTGKCPNETRQTRSLLDIFPAIENTHRI